MIRASITVHVLRARLHSTVRQSVLSSQQPQDRTGRALACVAPEFPTAGGMWTLGSEAEGDAPVQRREEEGREGEAECVWQEQERCRAGA